MVYAKIFVTKDNGQEEVLEMEGVNELGYALNYIQEAIFEKRVIKAIVEAVDPLAGPVAEMFNTMASSLDKLQNTQKILKGS